MTGPGYRSGGEGSVASSVGSSQGRRINGPRPRVHRIEVPRGPSARRVNLYLLPGRYPTLVDAGPAAPGVLDEVEAGIRAEGVEPGAIAQIMLTHTHTNHAGLAAALHACTGAPVLVHERGAETIARFAAAREDRDALVVRAARAAAVPEPLITAFADLTNTPTPRPDSVPAGAIRSLSDGAVLEAGDATWTVVHLPGHAADHIALAHRPSGVVISGDILLRGIPSQPGLEPRAAGGGRPRTLAVLLDSLKRLSRLDAAIVLPGHGAPIRAHRVLVARRLAHIRARLVAAHAAVADGARTLWDVMGALGGSIAATEDLPPRLAEAIALVDWLVEQRRITRTVREGVVELGVGGRRGDASRRPPVPASD